MSNVERAGAAYEAVLIDKVTGKVDQIVNSIEKLRVAFNRLNPASSNVAKNMTTIGQSFTQLERTTRRTTGAIRQFFGGLRDQVANTSVAIGQAIMGIGAQIRNLGLITTAGGVGILGFFIGSLKEAASAGEVESAFRAIFGGAADAVDDWIKKFSERIGRGVTETRQGLITFRALFGNLNLPEEEMNEMSKTMQELAVDFASFREMPDAEAIRRFQGALSGESENLKRFGIDVSQAALERSKFLQGRDFSKLAPEEKVLLRFNEIVRQMAENIKATGDAFRTRGSLPNQVKRLGAAFRGLRTSIGKTLEKVATDIVVIANEIIRVAKELGPDFIKRFSALGVTLAIAGTALTSLGVAMQALGPLIIFTGAVLAGLMGMISSPIGLVFLVVGALAALAASLSMIAGIRHFPFFEVFRTLSGTFAEMTRDFENAIASIRKAIEEEDWDKVWEIVSNTAELEFRRLGVLLAGIISEAIIAGVKGGLDLLRAPWKGMGKFAANLTDALAKAAAGDPKAFDDLNLNLRPENPFRTFFEQNAKRMEELERELRSDLDLSGAAPAGSKNAPGAGGARGAGREFFDFARDFRSIGGFGGAFADAVANLGPDQTSMAKAKKQDEQIKQGEKQNGLLAGINGHMEEQNEILRNLDQLRFA